MSATDVLTLHVIHHGDLRLDHDKLYRMLDRFKSEARPDVWFLGQPSTSYEDRDGYRYFTDLRWSGHLSGRRWNTFLGLLAEFDGEADIVVVWEDGEITGVRLRDHGVTEYQVVFSMGERIGMRISKICAHSGSATVSGEPSNMIRRCNGGNGNPHPGWCGKDATVVVSAFDGILEGRPLQWFACDDPKHHEFYPPCRVETEPLRAWLKRATVSPIEGQRR